MELEYRVITLDIGSANSFMKDTEVFVEHALSMSIEANIYVQIPQLLYFRSDPALHYRVLLKTRCTCKI